MTSRSGEAVTTEMPTVTVVPATGLGVGIIVAIVIGSILAAILVVLILWFLFYICVARKTGSWWVPHKTAEGARGAQTRTVDVEYNDPFIDTNMSNPIYQQAPMTPPALRLSSKNRSYMSSSYQGSASLDADLHS